MKQYLHDSEALFDSPQLGWEQMQLMLDKTLPVKNKKTFRELYLPNMIAAGFLTLFLLSSLMINQDGSYSFFDKHTRIPFAGNITIRDLAIAEVSSLQTEKTSPGSKTALPDYTKNEKDSKDAGTGAAGNNLGLEKRAGSVLPVLSPSPLQPVTIDRRDLPQNINERNNESIPEMATLKSAVNEAEPGDSKEIAGKTGKGSAASGWSLSAGLAVNTFIGHKQQLRPYPTAAVRYNISKDLFVSAGVGVGSPVTTQSQGTSKTVYLNDTVNNVYYYNDVKHYQELSYVDVPLMAGMQVSKKIAIQGGVQASVLLHAKSKTVPEPYDFQRMQASPLAGSLVAGTAGIPQTNYHLSARKMDVRFIAGLNYTAGKASFNILYQYAPRPSLKGDHISRHNNQLVSFNMQFKLK